MVVGCVGTGYVLRVELPVQRRLCPIFVRDVGSPDIHECFRGLTGSQRTPEIWGVTCVLDHKGSWEEKLPLVEFAYNNSYQASIQMAPYEALYRRPCRSPICWTEVGESSITGSDLIRDTSEKVSLIRHRLLTAQSRQKSYVDVRRRPLEFEVRDHVFLKVMPKRGVVRFGKRGKLSPRFIGPVEILERVGTVAYRLALPPSMSGVHEVFHVSMLRRYTPDPAHVVDWG